MIKVITCLGLIKEGRRKRAMLKRWLGGGGRESWRMGWWAV